MTNQTKSITTTTSKPKAKRKPTTPSAYAHVGCIQVKYPRMTPKQAVEWLETDLAELRELMKWAWQVADEKEQEALANLDWHLSKATEACTTAIRTGRRVRVLRGQSFEAKHGHLDEDDLQTIGRVLAAYLRNSDCMDCGEPFGIDGARALVGALPQIQADIEQQRRERYDKFIAPHLPKERSHEEGVELYRKLDKEAGQAKRDAGGDWNSVEEVWRLARVGADHLESLAKCKEHEAALGAQKTWPHDPDAPKPGRKPRGWDEYTGKGVTHA